MNNFDYAIFDFDGTIVDTGEGILKSLQYAFDFFTDEVPSFEDLKVFIGPPIHYSFTHFFGVPESEVEDYIKKYRERYSEIGIYECELYDGMLELLNKLKENKIKVGVASSKPQIFIERLMDHFDLTSYFDFICGTSSDDCKHIGKKDLVEKCMRNLGAKDLDKVIMIGDRYFDIDGGNEAGVYSCGIAHGYGDREEFQAHNADFIVDDVADLDLILFS